jgi:hypothetical protein
MIVYKSNINGSILKIEHFKSLNGGKKLSKSQEKLLGLVKIKINEQKGQ